MDRSQRARLVCWSGGYFLVIGVVLGLLGLRYLADYPWPAAPIAKLYTVLAFVSHFGVFAVAPWLLLIVPLTLLLPRPRVVVAASVCLGALLLAFVLVDSLVFAEDRFHVSALAVAILGSRTWGFALLYLAIFLVLCALLARSTRERFAASSGRALGRWLAALVVVPFLATQALHIWADATFYLPITSLTPYLPLFRPWSLREPFVWAGIVDEGTRDASLLNEIDARPSGFLHYPLAPLRCERPAKLPNILLLGIDAMRSDAVDPRIAPNVERFARRSLRFEQHWSGGNGTRVGLFALFYALPPTYWKEFYSEQRSPVLIDELQAAGYQLGIFPGNPPDQIVGLDRTAFRNVRAGELFATEGDQELARSWIQWLEKRDATRPFFGFLFFESAPGSCREGDVQLTPAPPGASEMQKRRACYDTAVHFADAQAGAVLDDLEKRGLLDDTIVIVTSDHGQEFDENGLGFHGHGSSYSPFQLHTPFIVHWPGMQPGVVARRTSHNDLAPTLLSDVLGCANPPSDYSSGGNLFRGPEWSWLVAASYTGFAVVEPTQVTVSSDVYFETRDTSTYRVIAEPHVDHDVLLHAIRETSRFHRE